MVGQFFDSLAYSSNTTRNRKWIRRTSRNFFSFHESSLLYAYFFCVTVYLFTTTPTPTSAATTHHKTQPILWMTFKCVITTNTTVPGSGERWRVVTTKHTVTDEVECQGSLILRFVFSTKTTMTSQWPNDAPCWLKFINVECFDL